MTESRSTSAASHQPDSMRSGRLNNCSGGLATEGREGLALSQGLQARQPVALAMRRREEFAVRRGASGDVIGVQAQIERGRRQLQLRQARAQQHQQVGMIA